MLSIRFDENHEWWPSSQVFERLFRSAVDNHHLGPELEEWQHVAEANGGLSMSDVEATVARNLRAGLRAAAAAELARLGEIDLNTDEGTYKVSLEKLLAVTDDH